MKIIGLTGGMGSGKSLVSKVFETLGIPVYDSDTEAKKLTQDNKTIRDALTRKFGTDIYIKGVLNKIKLAEYIFHNNQNLNFVNSVIHPVVKEHFQNWLQEQNTRYVIKESAILFETGIYKEVDILISVLAPKSIRIERIMKRDQFTEKEIEARLMNQTNDEERINKSDFLIENDENKLILPQILHIFSNLENLQNN